jgi:hypothetical protein
MLNRVVFWICISLVFSGCATTHRTVIKHYQAASICCESINEFNFESIQIGDTKSFDLNEKSPAYIFETGKSYFKAFVLPQSSYPYQVSVSSYMSVPVDIYWAYIFFPQVLTLNKSYEVVRSTDPKNFRLRDNGFISSKIEGQISFTEKNMSEKYLVILTTNELLKAKTSTYTLRFESMTIDGVMYQFPNPEKVLVPHSPTGRISVSVFGPR